ncbi:ROK family protein [Sphingosinicellaceae bacterium]|nr:ROK family protein [Sphingosinicellaceae bacterium]
MTRTAYAAVETGGTKILCRVVDDAGAVLAEGQWPTTTPDAAADAIVGCIAAALPAGVRLAGVGIAAFGPLIIDPASPRCGLMLQTPKPGWSGSNLRAGLADRLGVPVAVDTDVNAAAVAEQRLGAGRGLPSVAYLTVGTGIGAGLATGGRSLAGALHPEVGHVRLIRAPGDDFESCCPFHAECAEGLAAGPAISRRLGPGRTLADAPEVAGLVADYLGQLIGVLVLAWSPHRVVLGGGVMKTPGLIAAVDAALRRSIGKYGVGTTLEAPDFLIAARLSHAGLEGALLMARAPGTAI